MDLTAKIARKRNVNFLGVGLLIIICGFAGFFLYKFIINAKLRNCVFVEEKICWHGKKYDKLSSEKDIKAEAFSLDKVQEIKAPFDGYFSYSPSGKAVVDGNYFGKTPTLVFYNNNQRVKLLVAEAEQLKGQTSLATRVKKGDIVAKIYPGKIDFLDGYSVIQVSIKIKP